MGLRVQDLGLRVPGLVLRNSGLGSRVEALGFRVWGLGAEGLHAKIKVQQDQRAPGCRLLVAGSLDFVSLLSNRGYGDSTRDNRGYLVDLPFSLN